jgi:penicillin-binding protein 2
MFRNILIFILSSLFFVSCGSISLCSIHKNENVIIDRNSRTVAVFDKITQKYYYPYKKAASQTLVAIARTTKNKSLKSTIDIELQKYISSLFKDLSGSVIVMNVDGEILSMSSFPEYDANIFTDGISKKKWKILVEDPRKPFVNKNINALYPPGSTIAPALGLHYISSQKLKKDFHVNCESSFKVGKHTFICPTKHGYTDVTKAIREGCNDYFYKGAAKLGITDISITLKRYGLGKQTGIDLPREFHGLVPSKEWKKKKYNKPWYIGETLNTSIGQGQLLVTPLQMTQLIALIATGKLPTPHVIQKRVDLKDVLNEQELDNLPIIQKAMYEVCNHPKGRLTPYINSKVKIAAAQGFSQTMQGKAHSWIVSYAPYKNPRYIVTVFIEHDKSSGIEGDEIVSKIYDKLIKLNYIKGEKCEHLSL